MHRTLAYAFALAMTCTSLAHAADAARVVPVSDTQDPAQLQAAAEHHCNAALDQDRFNYNSMEECIAADIAKMQRAHNANAAKASSAAVPHGAMLR